MKPAVLGLAAWAPLVMLSVPAAADMIITTVIPGQTTTTTKGDLVELYNTGPGAVDLTDWIITDLDPASSESDVTNEGTFAPGSLSLPDLQPDEFAVVQFVDSTGWTLFSYTATNYGLEIHAPLATAASSFLGNTFEEVLLADSSGTPQDFVAWSVTTASPSNEPDSIGDLEALTGPTAGYGLTLGNAEWNGADSIADTAAYRANSIDFSGLDGVSTYGAGALRRLSTNGVFSIGSPDGPANWEAVERHLVHPGNPSGNVTTVDGIRPLRLAGDITAFLTEADSSIHPERRIARDEDNNDFVEPMPADLTAWRGVLDLALAGSWEECFDAADDLGYEVVEFLHTPTGDTYHILREAAIPGDPGYIGQGIFVFADLAETRGDLVLQIPHPRFDTDTLDQGALALPQIHPRVMMTAGTHRNNSTLASPCSGAYRRSDVAHYEVNFFHETHRHFMTEIPGMRAIQLHGFCCPGVAPYETVTVDVIVSNGYDAAPGVNDFARLVHNQVNAQNFTCDDGTPDADLTESGLYGESASVLGATFNIQGRLLNGVADGDECDTDALSADGYFVHIEQDPDIREEPQHIVDALVAALADLDALPVELDLFQIE